MMQPSGGMRTINNDRRGSSAMSVLLNVIVVAAESFRGFPRAVQGKALRQIAQGIKPFGADPLVEML
jgi:hypothetical protein